MRNIPNTNIRISLHFSSTSSHKCSPLNQVIVECGKYEKGGVQQRGAGGLRGGGGGEGGGCAAQSLIDDSLYAQHHPHGEEPPVIHCTLYIRTHNAL